jgi:tetratricopeptide (TPR) repeat protein
MESVSQLHTASAYLIALSGPKSGQWAAITGTGIILSVITGAPDAEIPAARVYSDRSGQIIVTRLASDVTILLNDKVVTAQSLLAAADTLIVGTDRYRLETDHEGNSSGQGVHQVLTDPAAALARADSLVAQREYQHATRLYEIAAAVPGTAADATYGLGVCALMTGDTTEATRHFTDTLRLEPSQADAHYYLGHIAEIQNDPDAAATKYRDAIAHNPQHAAARRQLQVLASRSGEGVYALLIPNLSPEARQSEELIRSLEAERPARIIAYLGYYWLPLALVFLLATILEFGGSHLIQPEIGTQLVINACITVQIFAIAYGCWVVVQANFVTFHCFQGRFQIRQGIIFRKVTTINLWQVRTVELKRTVVNVMTGDATLVFVLPPHEVPHSRIHSRKTNIKAIGFDHGPGLLGDGNGKKGCYWEMLTLNTMMRTIPAVKGIIQ